MYNTAQFIAAVCGVYLLIVGVVAAVAPDSVAAPLGTEVVSSADLHAPEPVVSESVVTALPPQRFATVLVSPAHEHHADSAAAAVSPARTSLPTSIPTEPVTTEVTAVASLPVVESKPAPDALAVGVMLDQRFTSAVAQSIHVATNREREKRGLTPLTYDDTLATQAQEYSQYMLTAGFFSHVDPTGCDMTCRFARTQYLADWWGENLASWQSSYTADDVQEVADFVMKEWLRSPGHRENLLSPHYTTEGVGVVQDGGTILVTVRFAGVE